MRGSRRGTSNGNGDGDGDREQNPATRRVVRSQFLQLKNLINEKRDDLTKTEGENFESILDEFDKLHVQVEKPREQVADAEALLDLTRTLVGSVRSMTNEGVSPSQFVSSLLIRYAHPQHSLDWQKLGLDTSPIFLNVHGTSTMLGPMDNQFKQRKTLVRKNREARPLTTTRPQLLDESVTDDNTDTDKNMATMFSILKRTKHVRLEYLIFNRHSFAQTVENLFALSFLVKDGRADITLDQNRFHFVSPKNAPASNLVSSKQVSYTHFVFRYDYQDWKLMKDVVPDGNELMPHRPQHCSVIASQEGMDDDNSQPALAVTPIRKLSRNRGLVVHEQGVVEESPECDDEDASRAGAIRRCKRKLH